jgi:hypothetical protein
MAVRDGARDLLALEETRDLPGKLRQAVDAHDRRAGELRALGEAVDQHVGRAAGDRRDRVRRFRCRT